MEKALWTQPNYPQSEKRISIHWYNFELQCPENVMTLTFEEREVLLPLQKRSEARLAYL